MASILTASFNKRREDFGSDKEHDDYLEEVEDLSEFSGLTYTVCSG
jgi:hypothetical protein